MILIFNRFGSTELYNIIVLRFKFKPFDSDFWSKLFTRICQIHRHCCGLQFVLFYPISLLGGIWLLYSSSHCTDQLQIN